MPRGELTGPSLIEHVLLRLSNVMDIKISNEENSTMEKLFSFYVSLIRSIHCYIKIYFLVSLKKYL